MVGELDADEMVQHFFVLAYWKNPRKTAKSILFFSFSSLSSKYSPVRNIGADLCLHVGSAKTHTYQLSKMQAQSAPSDTQQINTEIQIVYQTNNEFLNFTISC